LAYFIISGLMLAHRLTVCVMPLWGTGEWERTKLIIRMKNAQPQNPA